MDETGLVSVIITTHYRNDRLIRAIESVKKQTYNHVEILVVDDSGEAHAQSAVDDLEDVEYIAHEENQGPHAARSLGAQRAKGEYIQFLDDDDQFRPKKFEKQIRYLNEYESIGVVYSGLQMEFGDLRQPQKYLQGDILEYALQFTLTPCYTSSMLIRASVLNQILPLKERRHGADDVGMIIELAQVTKFGFIDEPLVIMGEDERSYGQSWAAVEGKQILFEEYAHLYEQFPPNVRQSALANIYVNMGRRFLDDNLWSAQAIRAFVNGVRHAPRFNLKYTAELISSIGGRPTYRVVAYLWRLYSSKAN